LKTRRSGDTQGRTGREESDDLSRRLEEETLKPGATVRVVNGEG
jgi:hypothetical protein